MESGKKRWRCLSQLTLPNMQLQAGNYLDKNNSDRRDLDIYTTQQALFQMIADSSILQQKKRPCFLTPTGTKVLLELWHQD